MSQLIGSVVSSGPVVDPRIADKIILRTTAPLPDVISCALYDVFRAVADQLEKENRIIGSLPVHCFFLGEESFTISLDSPERAICFRLAIYPLPNLAPLIGTVFCTPSSPKNFVISSGTFPTRLSSTSRFLRCFVIFIRNFLLQTYTRNHLSKKCVQYAHRHPELPLSDLLPSD